MLLLVEWVVGSILPKSRWCRAPSVSRVFQNEDARRSGHTTFGGFFSRLSSSARIFELHGDDIGRRLAVAFGNGVERPVQCVGKAKVWESRHPAVPRTVAIDTIRQGTSFPAPSDEWPNISVADVAQHFASIVSTSDASCRSRFWPRLTKQILIGDHAGDTSVRRLTRALLPMLWSEQDAALR